MLAPLINEELTSSERVDFLTLSMSFGYFPSEAYTRSHESSTQLFRMKNRVTFKNQPGSELTRLLMERPGSEFNPASSAADGFA